MSDDRGDRTPVVTCFLRNDAEVLLLRRSDAVGSYAGRWGGVAGHVEPGAEENGDPDRDPIDAARAEIEEETGLLDSCALVRAGDPFVVADPDHGEWLVHPFLFDCDDRSVETDEESVDYEWVSPAEILERETVPDLWGSYERVAPTVETVREDRERGAAYLSVRACEVLRDRAALAAHGDERERDGERGSGHEEGADADWADLAALARELRAARASMPAVANRVNRVMAAAEGDPRAIADRAGEVIADALAADDRAAERAAAAVGDVDRVLTLSRSGTVRATLDRLDPERVYVAESRPGGEGVGVAESLAADADVTLVPDAAVAHALATEPIDAAVVGADAVLPDGRVINKVGTRAAALAAARESVPVYAVTARDKVRADAEIDLEPLAAGAVYDGDADLDVLAPTFDVTPAGDATLVTEEGPLDPGDVAAVAREARERARWNDAGGADDDAGDRGSEE